MAFSLAYSTLDWQSPDLEKELTLLKKSGWHGWETRQSLDWLGSAYRVRRICQSIGIEVAAVCGPNVTLSTIDEVHEINKRRIEFASDLEVSIFMTKGPGRFDRSTTNQDLDQMAVVYEDLAVYAKPLGVTVAFHPHVNDLVDSASEWQSFMRRLDQCQLCFDMSHAIHWGYNLTQAVYDFCDRISYVHLHDYKDNNSVQLGEGMMCDYPAFLSTLKHIGYTGWITVCSGQTNTPVREKIRINRTYLKSIGY